MEIWAGGGGEKTKPIQSQFIPKGTKPICGLACSGWVRPDEWPEIRNKRHRTQMTDSNIFERMPFEKTKPMLKWAKWY